MWEEDVFKKTKKRKTRKNKINLDEFEEVGVGGIDKKIKNKKSRQKSKNFCKEYY